eukprot:gene40413-64311_t
MDGVQIGANVVVSSNGQSSASLNVPANSWGADGERVLTATIQRGSGAVSSALERHVYVAADNAHWSAASSSNVLWFDPDTLTANALVSAGATDTVTGTNDYVASAGGSRAYPGGASNVFAALSSTGRVVLLNAANSQLRLTVPTANVPEGNGGYYLSTMGQTTTGTTSGYWQFLFHLGLNTW